MKRNKYYIKPFGAVVIAVVALSVTAGAAITFKATDKPTVQVNAATEDISTEIPKLTDTRSYYRVHDGGATAMLDEKYQDYIYDMCEKYGIEGYEQLVLAMLYKESSFRSDAISKSGRDFGMAQINIGNHDWLREELGITDFLDPYQSIECGVFMLANALDTNDGSITKALVAYNAGQSKVNQGITETEYSNRVLEIIGGMTEERVKYIFD